MNLKRILLLITGLSIAGALLATYFSNPEEKLLVFKDYKAKAEAGDKYAQWILGRYYFSGKDVTEDLATSSYWFRKSAEQGYHEAFYDIGIHYRNGIGVEKNSVTAAYWLTRGACSNDLYIAARSQIALGELYLSGGPGLPQNDFLEAYAWYAYAARYASRSGDVFSKNKAEEELKGLTAFFSSGGRPQEIEKAHERLRNLELRLARIKIDEQLFERISESTPPK